MSPWQGSVELSLFIGFMMSELSGQPRPSANPHPERDTNDIRIVQVQRLFQMIKKSCKKLGITQWWWAYYLVNP